LIVAAILVSAAALKVGGALVLGRVMHMVAYDISMCLTSSRRRGRGREGRGRGKGERERAGTMMKRTVAMGSR
jgi:hypothetical protein